MSARFDHLFILTPQDPRGRTDPFFEALPFRGARSHPGQGTENILAFLGSGYLEILWIPDRETAQATPLGLVGRADSIADGGCPFGIGFRGPLPTTLAPVGIYRPPYLPAEAWIEYAEENCTGERPFLFGVVWEGRNAEVCPEEPMSRIHQVVIKTPHSLPDPQVEVCSKAGVVFRPGKTWHAEIVVETADSGLSGTRVRSGLFPLSLRFIGRIA